MGMSVDYKVYSISKLEAVLKREIKPVKGQLAPDYLLKTACLEAGSYLPKQDVIVLQSCDYWNEYDPMNAVYNLFDEYYGLNESDAYDLFKQAQLDWRYEGITVDELADKIGITLPEKEEEDE